MMTTFCANLERNTYFLGVNTVKHMLLKARICIQANSTTLFLIRLDQSSLPAKQYVTLTGGAGLRPLPAVHDLLASDQKV